MPDSSSSQNGDAPAETIALTHSPTIRRKIVLAACHFFATVRSRQLFLDAIIIFGAFAIALTFRFDGAPPLGSWQSFALIVPLLAVGYLFANRLLNIDQPSPSQPGIIAQLSRLAIATILVTAVPFIVGVIRDPSIELSASFPFPPHAPYTPPLVDTGSIGIPGRDIPLSVYLVGGTLTLVGLISIRRWPKTEDLSSTLDLKLRSAPALAWVNRHQLLAGFAVLFAAIIPPLVVFQDGGLSGDHWRYVSQGTNIASAFEYSTSWGERVASSRPPLYPGIFAAALKVSGFSLDGVLITTALLAAINASLIFLLGRLFFGTLAGLAGAVLVASSQYLNSLTTINYLDGAQATFVIASLLAMALAFKRQTFLLWGAAGILLGLAFLTKETALAWIPLPFILFLFVHSFRKPLNLIGNFIFASSFIATGGVWWLYVLLTTGRLVRIDLVLSATWVIIGIALLGSILLAMAALLRLRGFSLNRLRMLTNNWWQRNENLIRKWGPWLGLVFLIGWIALALALAEATGRSFPQDYAGRLIPYFSDRFIPKVFPHPIIFYLILASWLLVAIQALRGSKNDRFLILTVLIFTPLVLFVSNRGYAPRNLTIPIYISFIALGRASTWLLFDTCKLIMELRPQLLKVSVPGYTYVLGASMLIAIALLSISEEKATVAGRPPQNAASNTATATATSTWMNENLPPGTKIMSSPLHYQQLNFRTGGTYQIRPAPLWVSHLQETGILQPVYIPENRTNYDIRGTLEEDWLIFLQSMRADDRYILLSQVDLITDLQAYDIEYLFVSGDGFASSLDYLSYFTHHPAFTLVNREGDPGTQGLAHEDIDLSNIPGHELAALEFTNPYSRETEQSAARIGRRAIALINEGAVNSLSEAISLARGYEAAFLGLESVGSNATVEKINLALNRAIKKQILGIAINDARNEIFIYKVNQAELAQYPWPITMSYTTIATFLEEMKSKDPSVSEADALNGLSTFGVKIEPYNRDSENLLEEIFANNSTE